MDRVNNRVAIRAGTRNPTLVVNVRPLCATAPIGAPVTALASTFLGSRLVQTSLWDDPLAIDCTAVVRLTGLMIVGT